MEWESGAGPNVLVAHRCEAHRELAPINNNADALAIYVAERTPTARLLGTGPQGEAISAECGGCLAEDIEALYLVNLDLLDALADALRAHGELRRDFERHKRFL